MDHRVTIRADDREVPEFDLAPTASARQLLTMVNVGEALAKSTVHPLEIEATTPDFANQRLAAPYRFGDLREPQSCLAFPVGDKSPLQVTLECFDFAGVGYGGSMIRHKPDVPKPHTLKLLGNIVRDADSAALRVPKSATQRRRKRRAVKNWLIRRIDEAVPLQVHIVRSFA
jgi:hypothetical protein